MTSHRYARDVALVQSIGRLDSTTRTKDQTNIAFFWFEPFAIWNDITRTAVEQRAWTNGRPPASSRS